MSKMPKNFRAGTRKVKVQWDQYEFQQRAKKFIKQVPDEFYDILVQTAPEFSNAASKYTPPCIGRQSIQKKYFERPVLVLARLINGGYANQKATSQDKAALKSGKLYKVLNTKAGAKKGQAFAYCKTKQEIKRAKKIENRGLSRVMWRKRFTVYWFIYTCTNTTFN